MIALSNPRSLSGWFREAFASVENPDETQTVETPNGIRRLITVDGEQLCNVRERRAVISNQMTYEDYELLSRHRDRRWVDVFVRGKFAEDDFDNQLIYSEWIRTANKRWNSEIPVVAFGLDVAASERGDQSVLALGGPEGVRAIERWRHIDLMGSTGYVIRCASEAIGSDLCAGRYPVVVDADGIGAGVGSRLKELGVYVIEFHGSSKSRNPCYFNKRTEAYSELAEQLKEGWALPVDSMLTEELVAVKKRYVSDGFRYKLTPKEDLGGEKGLRSLIGRSPDSADAVAYLWQAVRALTVTRTISQQVDPVALCSRYGIEPAKFDIGAIHGAGGRGGTNSW
jgi:hypothetical protein